ncbi:hypothetical protein CDD82_2780 [Ophiocordyceps australis]|uniref:Rhodopsin domain-containing protein n=1 Tax=Ophiocordyceps australis TaxID=1399860 RepID=A0A2C5XN84_9HYPO|nr:hypothetical protein CDD82_2780 [Ophiocordyceps australis]
MTATACDFPVRNREPNILAMSITLLLITSFVILVRLVFKQFFSHARRLSNDDWLIVAAGAVGLPCIFVLLFGLRPNGLGRDVWTQEPATVLEFAKYFYVMEVLYITVIMFVRISLSVFYLDIFPGKTIRRLLIGTIIYHGLCGFTFIIKVIFQCTPISYNWTRYSTAGPDHGRCISLNASSWANGALGVAADLWLLAIPLSQLSKLQLHWKKKVGAGLMFITGAFGTLVSILRLHSIKHFANSTNPTWEQYGIVFWSAIEVMVGMICTSLPAMRLLLVRIWPRAFGSSASQSRSKSSAVHAMSSDRRTPANSHPGTDASDSIASSSTKVFKGHDGAREKGFEQYQGASWGGEVMVQRQVDIELADKDEYPEKPSP